jgi:hypothetical protein
MDYYMNDAGLVVLETTIKQTKFDITGETLASRIRKALQYSETIDQVVDALKTGNNGLYTNEWLIADTKTNEIAMFELGTHKTKLWRSSKDEWFGGTKGFYWGCNNAKDLDVRLETIASVEGRPANVVFRPTDRDRKWLELYEKHKGNIAEGFGFEAFTTPPLAAAHSLDAKFTTTAMAKELKTWGLFGPPTGKTWYPSPAERRQFPEARPLVSNDWTILTADAPPAPKQKALASYGTNDAIHLASLTRIEEAGPTTTKPVDLPRYSDTKYGAIDNPATLHPDAWHGTILPKTDADIWLAAAFADYEKIVARELALRTRARENGRELSRSEQDEIDLAMFAPYSRYRTAVTRLGKDIPLTNIHLELTSEEWYGIASGKGVLALSALRGRLGDTAFRKAMNEFGRANAGKAAATLDFLNASGLGHPAIDVFISDWLSRTGMPDTPADKWGWSISSFEAELEKTVIIYGTLKESDAQREAANRLQRQIESKWSNYTVPVLSDQDASGDAVKGKHLLLIGRPDTNSVIKGLDLSVLPSGVKFGQASFVVRGDTFANPHSSLIVASRKPEDPRYSIVIFAGLSADATWHCVEAIGTLDFEPSNVILSPAGGRARRLALGIR